MAGMLPGVECARRRRIHQGGSGTSYDPQSTAASGWTRRPYFSLFTSSHEMHHGPVRHAGVGGGGAGYSDDVNLGGAAREAKERLDMKLRSQLKSEFGRSRYVGNGQNSTRAAVAPRSLPTESLGTRNEGGGGSSRMLKWGRMKWRSMEQEECAVCLERFRIGEDLVNLQCGHRFHNRCLVPWLESNSHCPCCRMVVSQPSPSPSPV